MTALYTLKIVTDFAAAHTLRDYPGACSRMHGHNWKVEVEVQATRLDSVGMGIDFKQIKQATRKVTDELDHYYLNEIPPFDRVNPTAENIASYIYQAVAELINDKRVKVSAVTLWETERACVRYEHTD
ncbi:MAG: 6-carboxytetrahydropterin synthase QueD [Gammaproteobacteria bacterium]|jgi:6-pyruvoyltetrahydropterin/6-carboxytetrahydropterin synthase